MRVTAKDEKRKAGMISATLSESELVARLVESEKSFRKKHGLELVGYGNSYDQIRRARERLTRKTLRIPIRS